MTTSPLTSSSAVTPASAHGAEATSSPDGMLGQNEFLKLMVAQLQDQDPLQPANTNEYLNELAQFTEVEQTTNLASASELSGAVQLIGHTVTYADGAGGSATGQVQSVQSNAAGTTLTVEGTPGIKLSSVTEVQ
jgi:flagellar basal-body rod modification protein FlgD